MWRAIIYGCIPVTYFRAVELPFMRRLGIDYGQFSVNIQPDDFDTTQARVLQLSAVHENFVGPPPHATLIHCLLSMPYLSAGPQAAA